VNKSYGPTPEHSKLIRKLETIASLSELEKEALCKLPMRFRNVDEDTDIVREGETPSDCCMVVEGFVCRYKVLQKGQRQIMSFHIAGDIPDLQSLHLEVMDHSIGAKAPTRVAMIPHAALNELTLKFPGVMAAFWRDTLIDAAVFREWLAGVGRRTAHQRIAHVICEVFVRMRAVGLAKEDSFELPVTQAELGDSLGLSTVHVNRVLQDLRKDELITMRSKFVRILDWDRLQIAGDFQPDYLHLRRDRVA
jgi:CRP-like cAMP-binding protein